MRHSLSRWLVGFSVLMVLGMTIAACGSDPTATPRRPSAPVATPTTAPGVPTPTPQPATATPTPDPMVAFQPEWEALLAAAQDEGEVVTFIAGSLGRSDLKDLLPRFEEKYGIEVIFSTGSSRQNADKVLAERAANTYTLDVWMGGSGTAVTRLIPANALRPIEPLLIHPEILDKSNWLDDRWVWLDEGTQQFLFAFAANGSKADISYNTDLVDPDTDIPSIASLLDERWKGQIVMRDPRLAGVGAGILYYYVHPDLGPDFVHSLLTEQDVTIADDARQAADWLGLGKAAICLLACTSEVRAAEEQGLPVQDAFPNWTPEGGRLSSGSGTLFLVDSPKNPNAQKFFANWWLSREGQMMMQEASGNDSLRIDIAKDTVIEGSLREFGRTYVWVETRPDYATELVEVADFAKAALASVGK